MLKFKAPTLDMRRAFSQTSLEVHFLLAGGTTGAIKKKSDVLHNIDRAILKLCSLKLIVEENLLD